MYLLNQEIFFPNPDTATVDGIVAIGGDLSVERLILAYKKGIFPWFNEEDIPIWWSPDPRSVLFTKDIKVSKSMRNVINRGEFSVTLNQAFEAVINKCRSTRIKKEGTWITNDILDSYIELHNRGIAHSVEVWKDKKLVGGLYGISFGTIFFGESMYAEENNASKFAFIHLAKKLHQLGCKMIDCQIHNNHLESMGAVEIPRQKFLSILETSISKESMFFKSSNFFDKKP